MKRGNLIQGFQGGYLIKPSMNLAKINVEDTRNSGIENMRKPMTFLSARTANGNPVNYSLSGLKYTNEEQEPYVTKQVMFIQNKLNDNGGNLVVDGKLGEKTYGELIRQYPHLADKNMKF